MFLPSLSSSCLLIKTQYIYTSSPLILDLPLGTTVIKADPEPYSLKANSDGSVPSHISRVAAPSFMTSRPPSYSSIPMGSSHTVSHPPGASMNALPVPTPSPSTPVPSLPSPTLNNGFSRTVTAAPTRGESAPTIFPAATKHVQGGNIITSNSNPNHGIATASSALPGAASLDPSKGPYGDSGKPPGVTDTKEYWLQEMLRCDKELQAVDYELNLFQVSHKRWFVLRIWSFFTCC